MESRHLGVQAAVGQGPDLRGLPGHALLVGRRDAAVELRDPPRRRHPPPPGPGAHGRVRPRHRPPAIPGRSKILAVDHHAVDPAVQPGARRRPRPRLRRGASLDGSHLRDRRRPRWPTTPRSSARPPPWPPSPAPSWSGRTYTPLFPYFADNADSFRVLAGDYVDTDEGTGVVHMAPGFGEDDQRVCEAAGIALVCPVDDAGQFTDEVPDWAGRTSSTPTPTSSAT